MHQLTYYFAATMSENQDPFLRTLQLRGWQVSEDEDNEGARLSVVDHIQEVLKDARVREDGDVVLQGFDGGVECHALLLAAVSPYLKNVLQDNLEENTEEKFVMVFAETSRTQLQDLVEMAHMGKVMSKDKRTLELFSNLRVTFTEEASNTHNSSTNAHANACDQEEMFGCEFRQKTFGSATVLNVHTRQHCGEKNQKIFTPGKMLQCAFCNGEAVSMAKLRKHVRIGHNDEEWKIFQTNFQTLQCSSCDVKFYTKVELRSHERKVHGDFKTPLLPNGKHAQRKPATGKEKRTCTECGKVCQSLGTLEEHLFTHTLGKQPFQCGDCGQKSSSKRGLKVHKALHGILAVPLLCNQCGKTLCTDWEVRKHKQEHLLERRHSCRHCGKSFPDQSSCREHQESSHRPEKRELVCSYCSHRYLIDSSY